MEEEKEIKGKLSDRVKKLLGSGRGRKRKEEVKPWGKKERLLVISTLLFTFILIFLARLQYQPSINLTLPEIKLGEEKFVFEKEKESPVDVAKVESAKQAFFSATQGKAGTYGFYVFNLVTKQEYGIRENETFPAASLNKLPLMLTLYKEAEKGNIDLQDTYTLKESDKVGGAGSLFNKPAGIVLTYRELARLMGKQSDNTAFNILHQVLGDNKVQKTIEELGMKDTYFGLFVTTPADMGIFFRKLWAGNVVSDKNRDEILEFLTKTVFEDGWMPDGVGEGIRVAHKIGVEENSISDAGIIFGDRPFILVLMSHGVIESEARELIPELTQIFWEAEGE